MMEFVTGLVLGGLLVFCLMEFKYWRSYIIRQLCGNDKGETNAQWQNLMNYSGSERGQMNIEN